MENELSPVKKKNYYVNLIGGQCSIIRSSSEHLATAYAVRLFGTIMTPYIQEATPGQVSWVESMGGRVHEID
jgi:hypothetical protein